jgi:hypothetical protein
MPDGQIDPTHLEGEELRRWYLRRSQQIDLEREAAATKRRVDFYASPQVKGPMEAQGRPSAPLALRQVTPEESGGAHYGNLYAPPTDDLSVLRRQQAEFERARREISNENSWMSLPVLAPAAAVLGLEATAAIAARLASPIVARGPLVLTERMPYLRVGDNWATRMGRRADKFYKDMARAKPGWQAEPRVVGPNGSTLKPDLGAPPRTPAPDVRKYIEVKPNSPSGKAAAARQIKKYEEAILQKVRALFYDPKKFM